MTFIIYEKPIHSPFCGDGIETVISNASDKSGKILAHTRGWDDPSVVEDFKGPLKGKQIRNRGKGWRRLTGEKLSTAQEWAAEVTSYE